MKSGHFLQELGGGVSAGLDNQSDTFSDTVTFCVVTLLQHRG